MKHIFILNPLSGKGNTVKDITPKIIGACNELGVPFEFYISKSVGDSQEFVKKHVGSTETTRFYACGGDGTINEVLNEVYGKENMEIGVIPAGTGNDFIKSFSNHENFSDIKAQIAGTAIKMDLIEYNGRLGANVCNIGFDSAVADRIAKLKTKPFISGQMAYGVGIFQEFFKKMGNYLEVRIDDNEIINGQMLLVAMGVGSYYGGGYCALPLASHSDETLDLCMVKNITRLEFLSVIDAYKKGKHITDPRVKKFVTYRKCKTINIKCIEDIKLCADGEITLAREINFKVVPKAVSISLPKGVERRNK